jgi:flagellar basal body-associated protein FliL
MFVLVVIVWIYVIGLKHVPINNQKYLVRFLPIMVIPIWMSVIYTVACIAYIIWTIQKNWSGAPGYLSTIPEEPEHTAEQENHSNQENDLEAMFRLAKAAAGKNP